MTSKMRKSCLLVIGALLLVLTGVATQSEARVDVNIGINLPAHRFDAPPEVVVIPGTYVYAVPDSNVDILFFQGYWWRSHEGRWYRSKNYNGSWRYVAPKSIPRGLRAVPQDYRSRIEARHERVPHRDLQRNWKKWEREKYWERRRDQDRDDDRRGHGDQGREGRGEQRGRY
ncbi:MAG TPA: hypothetical protein VN328_00305 [Thermodesulfovibrionales bacterium]|nr:hypothetical protein [Thermodesulfovibrionales bacterium]